MEEKIRDILEDRYGELESFEKDDYGRAQTVYMAETRSMQDLVIKAGSGDYSRERLRREPGVLKLLEEIDYPAPRVLSEDLSGDEQDFIYFIMTREEGENIDSHSPGPRFKRMKKERKKKLLRQCGELLGRLHMDTGFENHGELSYSNSLEVKPHSDWSSALMEIVENHSLPGMEDSRFSDLADEARKFLDERAGNLETGDTPRLIHQDFRFGNLLVTGENVNSVLDWERAVAGHREYDLFKAERNLVSGFKTEDLREEYRKSFLEGYREYLELEDGWRSRKEIYQVIYLMEAMWTFDEWSDEIPEEVTSRLESNMREEFFRRMDGEETIPFSSMSV